jgi:uncharacterized membrane protein YeaQ/YmgE (transglycosylase-associated protein family)
MEVSMGIFSWIVVGLITGLFAGLIMKGGGFGIIGDIIVSVIGGVSAGLAASYFFHIGDPFSGINLASVLIAFAGAVLLLFVLSAFWLGEGYFNAKEYKASAVPIQIRSDRPQGENQPDRPNQ